MHHLTRDLENHPWLARLLGVTRTSLCAEKDDLDVETLYRYRLVHGA